MYVLLQEGRTNGPLELPRPAKALIVAEPMQHLEELRRRRQEPVGTPDELRKLFLNALRV